jgi:hypothetical protein
MTAPSGHLTSGYLYNALAVTNDKQLLLAGRHWTHYPRDRNPDEPHTWDHVADNVAGAAINSDAIIGYTADGRLHGLGHRGALGIGDTDHNDIIDWTDLGLDNIVAVVADTHTLYALDSTGTLHGTTSRRVTGATYSNSPFGRWGALHDNVAEISARVDGAVIRTTTGRILASGYNSSGRYGNTATDIMHRWEYLGIDNTAAVHLGLNTTYIVTDTGQLRFIGIAPGGDHQTFCWLDADITDVAAVIDDGAGRATVLCNDGCIYGRWPAHRDSSNDNRTWVRIGIDGGHTPVRRITRIGSVLAAHTANGIYIVGDDQRGVLGYGPFHARSWLRLPDDDTVHTVFAALIRDGHNPHQALATAEAIHT